MRYGTIALWMVTAACGDVSSANGEFGRLSYALATDYEVDGALDEILLVTNHPIQLQVDLTEKGSDDAGDDAASIRHTASDGVVEQDSSDSDVAGFSLTVADSGSVTVSSMLDGEVFDRVDLKFAKPEAMDLVSWVRPPWAEDWQDSHGTGTLTVEEGGQISFLAIPEDGSGERIAGEFTPLVTVDPPELAVPDATVVNVYEDEVWTDPAPVTFFAVNPGTATFTIADPGNGLTVQIAVEITPLAL